MKFRVEILLWPLNLFWPGRRVAKNVHYGEGKNRILDVYDREPNKSAKPVIIFWYGGAWTHGKKSDYKFVGSYLSQYAVTIIPNYPLYPEQTYPGFIGDAEQVLKWVKENISSYGGDPGNVYIAGHSAGAHTAVALVMRNDQSLRGCIGLGTPATMSVKLYDHIFNGNLKNGSANTISLIDHKVETKFLLLQGEMDQVVPPQNADRIKKSLEKYGNKAQVQYMKKFEHFGILQAVGSPFGRYLRTHKILKNFIS